MNTITACQTEKCTQSYPKQLRAKPQKPPKSNREAEEGSKRRAVLCKDAESNGPQTRPEVLWCAGNKLRLTHTQSSVRALFPSTAAYLQDILFFQFCCSQPKETCALCPHLW